MSEHNLTSSNPFAIYFATILAEKGTDLSYGELSIDFLKFVEKDNDDTREVLQFLGLLLFFYKNRDDEGRCVLDPHLDEDRIFGSAGLVAAFRVYCMLEHFTRRGWIRSKVGAFSVLETIDRPHTKIEINLTPSGLRSGNALLWRHYLRGGQN